MLSKYALSLTADAKVRYLSKIELVNGLDPYSLTKLNDEMLPPVQAADLLNYLVVGTSAYTLDKFKAYKSMDAYNHCVNGWVKEVGGCTISGKFVVVGKVRHSQSFSAAPAHCWVITEQDGSVVSAHCTCKAGLGEACSHVAAMLFYVEMYNRIKGPMSCTQTECKWLLPAHVRTLTYRPLAEMDFRSPRQKLADIESQLAPSSAVQPSGASSSSLLPAGSSVCGTPTETAVHQVMQASYPPVSCAAVGSTVDRSSSIGAAVPSQTELDSFYAQLSQCRHKPALLSLIAPYCDRYISDSVHSVLPLTSLYNKIYTSLSVAELISIGEALNFSLSDSDIEHIEMATAGQSANKKWFDYRAGPITASKMKQVCSTDIDKPSQTLLKSVCYPLQKLLRTPATDWGTKNEALALQKYKEFVSSHADVHVDQCGLIINPDFPHIAASPDSLVGCKCCGRGVVEVKCPYKHRFMSVDQYLEASATCLTVTDGEVELTKTHPYYFQIQTQMHVCEAYFCDFVVCLFEDGEPTIIVKRVLPDAMLWNNCRAKATTFFKTCVLPELLGKVYTRGSSL